MHIRNIDILKDNSHLLLMYSWRMEVQVHTYWNASLTMRDKRRIIIKYRINRPESYNVQEIRTIIKMLQIQLFQNSIVQQKIKVNWFIMVRSPPNRYYSTVRIHQADRKLNSNKSNIVFWEKDLMPFWLPTTIYPKYSIKYPMTSVMPAFLSSKSNI